MISELQELREKCYRCYRPQSSCMCGHIRSVRTETKFVILMHPKEYKKVKNGTGHLTHLSLQNSELYVGIGFDDHARVNELINDPDNCCYVLYPSKKSLPLNTHNIAREGKQRVVFIMDATWDCSKKMLAVSRKLAALEHISFEHTRTSQFIIKTQPDIHCLSTIESTLCVLELLNEQGNEAIGESELDSFLEPFEAMVRYQQSRIVDENDTKKTVRYKPRREEKRQDA